MGPNARLFAAVGAGASIGSVARYLLSVAAFDLFGSGALWGTLAANILGSFLIGLYATMTGPGGSLEASLPMRQFVLAGFCGGFTTFSIFSLETLLFLDRGQFMLAGTYAGASLCLWLAAVWLGYLAGTELNRLRAA
jgi:fluoride exporter